MPQFHYKVRTPAGVVNTGTTEAASISAATEKLKAQRYVVLEITGAKKGGLGFGKRVKAKDIALFSRQLATLVTSGVPIVQGLSILGEQIESKGLEYVVNKIKEDIEAGISIADAMKKHPTAFSELYVAMVKAGEVGGILDVILDRLSGYLEASEELKGKIKSAMTYPVLVAFIAVAASGFMLTGVIPQFAGIFQEMGVDLPLPTIIMLALSDFVKANILFLIAGPTLIFVGLKQLFKRSPEARFRFDAIKLKLPMFGLLIKKTSVAKFTRTLGTLVKSGVPIIQALETVAKTSGNSVIERAIMAARESIKEGERIAPPLRRCGVFPPMVIQMISVGEETGTLDTMLSKIADFYDREVDDAVKAITSMIEPLIIVFMGGVIGGMVLALFLPMFELTNQMSQG
ncbi:MAG: type II secretion system F family protein [Elusimicrobiota bacterium]